MEIIKPSTKHTHTVFLLHGRGSTASQFKDEFFESQASDDRTLEQIYPGVKWVLPTANTIPSTQFGSMSQWFDMQSTEDPHEHEADQQSDLMIAVNHIQDIIKEESCTIGVQNIVLGGISQGCAVAIHALLKQDKQLAGFVGLCSWLPLQDALTDSVATAALETPVFLAHAEDDDVIAIRYAEQLRDWLSELGMTVEWHTYSDDLHWVDDNRHWVNEPQGIDDLVVFLDRVLKHDS